MECIGEGGIYCCGVGWVEVQFVLGVVYYLYVLIDQVWQQGLVEEVCIGWFYFVVFLVGVVVFWWFVVDDVCGYQCGVWCDVIGLLVEWMFCGDL